MTCPAGSYPIQRHNKVCGMLACVMSECLTDVEREPLLQSLTVEQCAGGLQIWRMMLRYILIFELESLD